MKWNVDDKLELDEETMQSLGHRVIDIVAENLATLSARPVSRTGSRAELDAELREGVPVSPRDPDAVLEKVRNVVLANMIHVDHPRNFGFVPGPSNYVGALGDFLASGFNDVVLRMCTTNPRTTEKDVDDTVVRIADIAAGLDR